MLDTERVAELTEQAVRKWIDLERVMIEPTIDSQGEEALRVTLVLDRQVAERVTGDQALNVLRGIQQGLWNEGETRLPIIEYATEDELRAEIAADQFDQVHG